MAANPFIGEISMFAGNFAPRGWALCDGQVLAINSNTALFSLLGTTYGGDGRTTFALPDLRGRAPMHAGSGPGLTARPLGQKGGTEKVTIAQANLPAGDIGSITVTGDFGTHGGKWPAPVSVDGPPPTSDCVIAGGTKTGANIPQDNIRSHQYALKSNVTTLSLDGCISVGGSSAAVQTSSPYGVINFIIALQGIFPTRA